MNYEPRKFSLLDDVGSLRSMMKRLGTKLALLGLASAFVSIPSSAENRGLWHPRLVLPTETEITESPAFRYANMTDEEVERELSKRRIEYRREAATPGVRFPIRLSGRLNGVWVHSVLPAKERKESPYEILDGRLALALDDFCALARAHGFVEIIHYTMYRPPTASQLKDSDAQHRHPGGLAIDIGALKRQDGSLFSVAQHWPAELGAKTCGEEAREVLPRRGRELVSLTCEAHDARLFHYQLSPHHDARHADHLHFEIKAGVRYFLAE